MSRILWGLGAVTTLGALAWQELVEVVGGSSGIMTTVLGRAGHNRSAVTDLHRAASPPSSLAAPIFAGPLGSLRSTKVALVTAPRRPIIIISAARRVRMQRSECLQAAAARALRARSTKILKNARIIAVVVGMLWCSTIVVASVVAVL